MYFVHLVYRTEFMICVLPLVKTLGMPMVRSGDINFNKKIDTKVFLLCFGFIRSVHSAQQKACLASAT